jgi:hypothetical protein
VGANALKTCFATGDKSVLSIFFGLAVFALTLAGTPALAGSVPYKACCKALDTTPCPTVLHVVGPGSETGGGQAQGMWLLDCDSGGAFSESAHSSLIQPEGTVLTPLSPKGASCFDAACAIPPSLCLVAGQEQTRVALCDGGGNPDSVAWSSPATEATAAVVIEGRVIKARGSVKATSKGDLSTTIYQSGNSPRTLAPKQKYLEEIDKTLPEPPPNPCKNPSNLRGASSAQVDAGNEAAIASNWPVALMRYRAAISMNPCNAFAWADMGEALLALDEAGLARTALEHAVQLMPAHYAALANLGRAEEDLGNPAKAAQYYRQVLAKKPGYRLAEEGLQRVSH